jgi:PKHD-type hydroxylase
MSQDNAPSERLALQYMLPTHMTVSPEGVGSMAWPAGLGPFGQMRDMALHEQVSGVMCLPGSLTPEECAMVVAEGTARPAMPGRVELGSDVYRVSHIAWLEPHAGNEWLYHKVGSLFLQVNQHYGFDLVGMFDALQFTQYGPGQHFDWHMDVGRGATSLRKLSLTIQLSDPADYDDGNLGFVGLDSQPEARGLGAATVFPSYMGHCVTPVTRGVRRSLVAWASGAAFR